ncbi:MAG: PIG-L family deacetylase [Candidatus Omnitrophica bacterium]|nr:PIG-L family deacetylase [Candidatus Omnitrophota bacterium]
MKKVLVVAVHPDDETLGCGGTLLRHKAAGDAAAWLIVTSALTEQGYASAEVDRRAREIAAVGQEYGFSLTEQLGYPTKKLRTVGEHELIDRFSRILKQWEPQIVYLPFAQDVHGDHRVAFTTMFSALKSFRAPFVEKVYMMETISETEFAPALPGKGFTPNVFVDISAVLDSKMRIMNLYSAEMGAHPFPRSVEHIRALALHRGATCGRTFAEAFMLLKEIW